MRLRHYDDVAEAKSTLIPKTEVRRLSSVTAIFLHYVAIY